MKKYSIESFVFFLVENYKNIDRVILDAPVEVYWEGLQTQKVLMKEISIYMNESEIDWDITNYSTVYDVYFKIKDYGYNTYFENIHDVFKIIFLGKVVTL